MNIREFRDGDTKAVISLWQRCGLTRPWNDPWKDVTRKLSAGDGWFLVGEADDEVIASVMVGYDGHRGSIFYLAVAPGHRGRGYGAALMRDAEERLRAVGCPKLNLLVRTDNHEVLAFYDALGYAVDPVTSLGKRLIADD